MPCCASRSYQARPCRVRAIVFYSPPCTTPWARSHWLLSRRCWWRLRCGTNRRRTRVSLCSMLSSSYPVPSSSGVCVCVYERERERARARAQETPETSSSTTTPFSLRCAPAHSFCPGMCRRQVRALPLRGSSSVSVALIDHGAGDNTGGVGDADHVRLLSA